MRGVVGISEGTVTKGVVDRSSYPFLNRPSIHFTRATSNTNAEPLVTELSTKAINTVRILAADMVQKANSGHPG